MAATDSKKLLDQQQIGDSVQQLDTAAQQDTRQAGQQRATVPTAQAQQNAQAQNVPNVQPVQRSAQDASRLIGLPGVSDTTKQTLGSLVTNGYQPSQQVSQAMAELKGIIARQPAAYQSQYYSQLQGIMNKILGRESFSYDMAADPLYQQYRQQYVQGGRQAMEDAMGRAATLTGGYGSSYGGSVGQQTYNEYLKGLNDRGLELYQLARDAYDAEGDRLTTEYALLNDAYDDEYGKWQDEYSRWLAERDYAQNAYETERGYDYDDYTNRLSYWQNIAAMEQDQANAEREYSNAERDYYYNWAIQLMAQGKTPSAAVLEAAGLSAEDVAKLLGTGSGSGGGTSAKKKTGSGSAAATGVSGDTAKLVNLTGNALKSKISSGGSSGYTAPKGLTEAEKAALLKKLRANSSSPGKTYTSLYTAVK